MLADPARRSFQEVERRKDKGFFSFKRKLLLVQCCGNFNLISFLLLAGRRERERERKREREKEREKERERERKREKEREREKQKIGIRSFSACLCRIARGP